MSHWIYHSPPGETARLLESRMALHPAIAEILAKTGITALDAAERHIGPTLAQLSDPFQITNVDATVARLVRAIDARERIAILGDYDVDGVTSTTLLVSVLRELGAETPHYYVPRRLEEGYGMSAASIERVLADGPFSLFVALDCGTNSVDETNTLVQHGADVIIIDHHRSKAPTGTKSILVNPHVNDTRGACPPPWRNLCTVGLVFKVCHALLKHLRARGDAAAQRVILKEHLDLVAMGTIADLVPLTDENRLLTYHGLRQLRQTTREGLRALMQTSGITQGSPILPTDISFRIGPRINASGRLADALLPVEMLLSPDATHCAAIAGQLNEMNRERQEIERQVSIEAQAQLEPFAPAASALVAFGDWHPGVVGIVAGKLCRHFNRPCIVLGREGRWAKGSGRSIARLNLVDALQPCATFLESWGGHPMAVGITVEWDKAEQLREHFDASVKKILSTGTAADDTLTIAAWLGCMHITDDLLDQLEKLHPFGEGNPEPTFGISDITLRTPPVLFGESNYRFQIPLDYRRRLGIVAWRKADRIPPLEVPIDLAVKLTWNHYNGRRYPQAELMDWRLSD
ncbi:MAG: single-stranded-DNA-specific exonuclease RecJ [Puniceicoccales bacterium]|nr:single-stranded-DNA-specific exonuclease RecJ [Puniceicoccales bacterium]